MERLNVVWSPDVEDGPSELVRYPERVGQPRPEPIVETEADRLADVLLNDRPAKPEPSEELPRTEELKEFSTKPRFSQDGKRRKPSRKDQALIDLRVEFGKQLAGQEPPMKVVEVAGEWLSREERVFSAYAASWEVDQDRHHNWMNWLAYEWGYTPKPKAKRAYRTDGCYHLYRGFKALERALFPHADGDKPYVEVCGQIAVPVASVNAFAKPRRQVERHLWDLVQFDRLRDTLEYDDMEMLRGEYRSVSADIERLSEAVQDAKRSLALWAILRSPAEDGVCRGTTTKGHRCRRKVKGSHCSNHAAQRPESPPFLISYDIVLRQAVEMAWALWLGAHERREEITRRGRFLRSVLRRMLAERSDNPDPAGQWRPEYYIEDDQTRRARWLWAEGRALDLTIEGHRDSDGLFALGDDAPEDDRNWEVAQSTGSDRPGHWKQWRDGQEGPTAW